MVEYLPPRGLIRKVDIQSILLLVLVLVFIFLSGFFSLTETAYSSMNKYRMEALAEDGTKSAALCLWIAKKFDFTLNTILIGNNAVNVALSYVSTFLFVKWMPGLDDSVASLIASVITTIFVYVFGETLPKQLGKRIPNKVAQAVSVPLLICFILFFPLTVIFVGISYLARFIFKGKQEPELTEEDFNAVLDDNEEHGAIESDETDIIQNSFDFTDTSVKEVFTPKEKMFTIDLKDTTNEKLVEKVLSAHYSRIPVYYGDPDKIIGILIVKSYLADYLKDKRCSVIRSIEKPYIVSPNIMMDDMVEGFRNRHTQVALVYKDKVLLGMITTEDVLEELVGPISEKNQGEKI